MQPTQEAVEYDCAFIIELLINISIGQSDLVIKYQSHYRQIFYTEKESFVEYASL